MALGGQTCFRHLNGEQRQAHLERLASAPPSERRVDLRGIELKPDLWELIGSALARMGGIESLLLSDATVPHKFELHDVEVLDEFAADGVEFGGEVRIVDCRFRHAFFMGSEFQGQVSLLGVEFEEKPMFQECTFAQGFYAGDANTAFVARDGLDFTRSSFRREAVFRLTGGSGEAIFRETGWQGIAAFSRTRYAGGLSFLNAHFSNDLLLADVVLGGTLSLAGAQLDGLCAMEGTRVGNLSLRQAILSRVPELGEIEVDEWAVLDQAVFEQQVRLRILASTLHCHRTIFTRGVSISLGGELIADGSFFPPPSDIAGVADDSTNRSPRVTSLRRADVGGLNISDVDLSGCLFAGIHHLEGSRLGAGLEFGRPPGRWRSTRDVLAEEQWLRAAVEGNSEWSDRDQLLPGWFAANDPPLSSPPSLALDPPARLGAGSVADTYRALRQAREENKDSPGAAAFYFGEMEMRRKSLSDSRLRDSPERAVLAGYWLLSGYGLRAWRSLLTLLLLLVLSSFLLWKGGFRAEDVSFLHAGRVAVASATSLVRPVDDSELNGAGFTVEIVLRFMGPALLALALLAVRARIKR